LQKETSGTTMTFRGNPIGIIKALGIKGSYQSYDDDDPTNQISKTIVFSGLV